ncbi:MAG: AAA family ATPase [Planctomycetes bacterium]|nr:AAA family ATPase [Planctomycetota bacterium]
MDLAYWGFDRWPFQHHQSDGVPAGAVHEEALARLLFLVEEQRRCGLLTGPAGIGKSCLLQVVKSHAQRLGRLCIHLDATGINPTDFAWQFADQLHADCEPDSSLVKCWSQIQRQLANSAIVGQSVVVLVDNLDQCQPGASGALRRLMNLADAIGPMTVLMTARNQAANELPDDIELSVELTAWTAAETSHFINESMRRCGARVPVFSGDAVTAVYDATRGNPSQVLRMCDLALLAAMADECRVVDARIITALNLELNPGRQRLRRNQSNCFKETVLAGSGSRFGRPDLGRAIGSGSIQG